VEIRDYASQLGWRLWILVLLPLAAGGAAFGLLADTPRQYEADAILTVPSSVVGSSSSGSVAQYMANFEQAIVSEPVIEDVVDEVGVDASDVRDTLTATQLGNSNLVRVSYRGSDPDVASRIVDVATRSNFTVVAQIQLPFGTSSDVLQSRVRSTTSDLDSAETELENFLLDNGLVLPREQYLLTASDVSRLEGEILQAQAEGASTVALEAALQARRRELAQLGALLPEYERLQAAVDRAEEDLDAAEDELRLAKNQLAHLTPQMTDISTEPIGRMQTIGKGVGVAAGGGLIAAMALMLLFPTRASRHAEAVPARP
jgi:uncharacterized protein involved in exopolysaccharide biosynthesis